MKNVYKILGIMLMCVSFLVTVTGAFADNYSSSSTFIPTENNVTYQTPIIGMYDIITVDVGTQCVNITSSNDWDFDHCTLYSTSTIKTLCIVNSDCVNGQICSSSLKVCVDDTTPTGGSPAIIINDTIVNGSEVVEIVDDGDDNDLSFIDKVKIDYQIKWDSFIEDGITGQQRVIRFMAMWYYWLLIIVILCLIYFIIKKLGETRK